jgi:phage tail sheath protein FI
MASVQRPGVYVEETLNPVSSYTGPAASTVATFVGTSDRGPIAPTLVKDWGEYVANYGGWNTTASNDLPTAVSLFFANGGSPAYVLRVVDELSAASATRTFSDRGANPAATLILTAKTPGAWGNNLSVKIADSSITGKVTFTLYQGTTVVERWPDLSMTATDSRYAVSYINQNSIYVTAIDANSASLGATRNPSVQSTPLSLGAGSDGVAVSGTDLVTALSSFDVVEQSLLLNIAGYTDASTVNGAISYAEGRDDVFVIIDGIDDVASEQIALAATYQASSQAAVYYPPIVVSDQTRGLGTPSNATRLASPGGAVAGLMVKTDTSRGVFKAPAGLLARLAGAVSVRKLTNAELDNLNSSSAPVNAIKFVSGSGIVVMGAKTLNTGYVDKYVPVRRTLIYLRKSLMDLTEFAVFEPNDEVLWRRLSASISSFLTQFWSQGGLRGATPTEAFFVRVDSSNNTQTTIDNGEVHIEIGVALQRPAEYIIIKIGQFDGGSTVTVA